MKLSPHDRIRSRAAQPGARQRGLPHLYRGHKRRTLKDIYDADHADARHGGRFRWLLSTCLAAAVGSIAIFAVIYGSSDRADQSGGLLPALKRMRDNAAEARAVPEPKRVQGLNWSMPRSDRLQVNAGATSTRFIIHESHKLRRDGREYIRNKPFVRIVARLAAVPTTYADVIPPFNPFKLYATTKPVTDADEDGDAEAPRGDVSIKVVELLGGILPGEDGQELDTGEVADLVARTDDGQAGAQPGAAEVADAIARRDAAARDKPAIATQSDPHTTVLTKTSPDGDDADGDLEGREVRVVHVGRGDTLQKILTKAGADSWQARTMIEAGRSIFPEATLAIGQQVHLTLVPSLTHQGRMEPIRFSVFAEAGEHKLTVRRNAAGEFVAAGDPYEDAHVALSDNEQPQASSLYSSIYHAGLVQNVPSETLLHILKIHAYEIDFRRRLRAGDAIEFFFDLKEDAGPDAPPGELLFTAITAGGETSRFYRFRSPDGLVDFYDENGENSRKFLMRRPVRGEDVRLTSGYGVRFHPLLNERKMHTGVDWAAPPGTPIMAAGNGVVEEAGRKGQYGNYIRIRHANGYQTTYGHMQRLGAGIEDGSKVRQGQIIGYVGSTGLSSGPHLHFEVLVNSRFVDPMSIQVPRERKLDGKMLADFQKERAHIDDLMRRSPVLTASK